MITQLRIIPEMKPYDDFTAIKLQSCQTFVFTVNYVDNLAHIQKHTRRVEVRQGQAG